MTTAKPSVNIPTSDLLATELYLRGRKLEIEDHASQEVHKIGTLRGGSSGCLTDEGEVYGTCHRLAFARFKGFQSKIEDLSYTWFDAGYANEDAWEKKLVKAVKDMGPAYVLKAEEECPIVWEAGGIKVTGRPDFMVFKDGAAILGLELKVVCAVNSAISIYCEDKPKISNLIQAAHYSMAHGCPFNLVYSYRSRSIAPGWAYKFKDKLECKEKTFPARRRKDGTYGKEFTKREYLVEPFTKEFRVGFEDDRVYYITDRGVRVDTPLTATGIRRYYELIAGMDKKKDLHTRISSLDLEGKMLPYNPCNYCPFVEACDSFENDYDSWLDKVRLICEEES